MTRGVLLLVVIAVALSAAGCKTAPEGATPAAPTAVPAPTPAPPAPAVAQQIPTPEGFEQIVLTVDIPVQPPAEAQAAPPAASHGGAACPMTESSKILGITIGSPHGIVVSNVLPDGPAAKAGIKAGDGIIACNGKRVSCPSSLRPMLGDGTRPVTVKLTIFRPDDDDASPAGGAAGK